MAEPDTVPRSPDANPPAMGSWVPGGPLDVSAARSTPSYPDGPTATFGGTPDADNRPTASAPTPGSEVTDPPSELPNIPGYRVIRVLGSGGMGTVFKAVHLALNRVVALKVINAGWTTFDAVRTRFEREVKTLAQIEHPNIVPVYHAGSWQGLPYLEMKFVPGKTLYHHLERVRRDLPAACRLMVQVARAVHYLHARGIVHRDLKPLNILMADDDTPLVADFGVARTAECESGPTISLIPVGTRQYMSPEQTRGGRENYAPACDIWALGVVLYELLAGRRPFGHDDPVELFRQIRYDPLPPFDPALNVPPGLDAITRKCMAKEPADRYATAEEVACALERWLAGDATAWAPAPPAPEARPAPALAETPPAARVVPRRNRALVALGVLAVVALIALPAAVIPWKQPEPVPKPVAERVAAGEKVKLTDDRGRPTVEAFPIPGHPLSARDEDGFHVVSSNGPAGGLFELAREPLALPVRVEAEVAVKAGVAFGGPSAVGVTVGRRSWVGAPVPHHSLVRFCVSPDITRTFNEWQLIGRTQLYWWEREFGGSIHDTDEISRTAWPRGGANENDWRFAPIVVEVHADRITGSIDGVPRTFMGGDGVKRSTLFEKDIRDELARKVAERPQFPAYTFHPPAFGPGIGVFCLNADGVVRNLTVSKIDP